MSIRHPSTRKLREWLDDGAPARIGRHVATCDRCTTVLERISTLNPAAKATLRAITQPAADLDARMRKEVGESIRSQETLGVVGDLFALGWHTANEWLRSEDEPA